MLAGIGVAADASNRLSGEGSQPPAYTLLHLCSWQTGLCGLNTHNKPHFPVRIKWVRSDIAGVGEIGVIDFKYAHACVENTGIRHTLVGVTFMPQGGMTNERGGPPQVTEGCVYEESSRAPGEQRSGCRIWW